MVHIDATSHLELVLSGVVHARTIYYDFPHCIIGPCTQLAPSVGCGVQGWHLDTLADDVCSFMHEDAVAWAYHLHGFVYGEQRSLFCTKIVVTAICCHMDIGSYCHHRRKKQYRHHQDGTSHLNLHCYKQF